MSKYVMPNGPPASGFFWTGCFRRGRAGCYGRIGGFVLTAILAVLLQGCHRGAVDMQTGTARTREHLGQPEFNIQQAIDSAEDGAVVVVPRGRFVLKKGLVVSGRFGLTLRGETGTEILVDDVNKDVILIEGSWNILVQKLHLAHVRPLKEYRCHGSVVKIIRSKLVSVSGCELRGSGAIGVNATHSNDITVDHCWIHHNTFNALYLSTCCRICIHDNVIEENANLANMHEVDDLQMNGNTIRANGGYWEGSDMESG